MADTRNFEINIPVVKKAGENIFDCGDKIRNAADEIESICKHLSGTSSLSSVAESLLALQSKLYGNASKMNALGNGTLQCMHFYESAEASLLGQDICDYEERKSADRTEPSPVPSETDKPGDPGQEKGTPSKQESTDSKSMTSCWVEDFDYINDKGEVCHYEKAYLNAKGVPTAYYGKTSWKASFIGDTAMKYAKGGDKKDIKKPDEKVHKVYKQGKGWLTKEEIDNETQTFSKKVGTLLEYELMNVHGEATLLGAEVSGEYGCLKGSASAKLLTAEFDAHAGVGAYLVKRPDGTYTTAYGLGVTAGASASVISVAASGSIGYSEDGFTYIGAGADVAAKVGEVKAEVGACCQYVPGEGLEIQASGSAGAYAVDATASGAVTIAGVKVEGSASFRVGVGVNASVGYKDGKFSFELGAALGIGFNLSFSIDFKELGKKIGDAIKSVAETVWNGVKKAASAVWDWFSSW